MVRASRFCVRRFAQGVRGLALGLAAACALPGAHAGGPAELRLLVETSTDMPMMQVRDGQLVDGFHRDLGLALARELKREARFELLPRKRVMDALASGAADLSCHYLPGWLPGDFDWSKPFIPNALVLVSAPTVNRPASLQDLAGVPVGTVLGFSYPDLEAALGARFVRDNAPTSQSNLMKLAAGRVQHAVLGEMFYRYQLARGALDAAYGPPLLVHRYKAQCAVSRKGQVTVQELNRAIDTLERTRQVQHMLDKYALGPLALQALPVAAAAAAVGRPGS